MGTANLSHDILLPPARGENLLRSKILIIDDEEVNVRLLKRILQFGGFEYLSSTTDSRLTVALFEEIQPDLSEKHDNSRIVG
jgi:PleD family two-component response regulator